MKSNPNHRKILSLNALYSVITGNDEELYQQIRTAIHFALNQKMDLNSQLDQVAQNLLHLYLHHNQKVGFYLWEFEFKEYGPLSIHARIQDIIEKLSRYSNAVLVVHGMRQFIRPVSKRWTSKAQDDYRQIMEFIEQQIIDVKPDSLNINILFI